MKFEITAEHLSQLIAAITTPWGALTVTVTVIVLGILLIRRDKKANE